MTAPGWQLRGYLWLMRAASLAAPLVLRRRLRRGKEDPARWPEKLGQPGAARPEGRLIWLHGVGLGEVMALRGLIEALRSVDPGLTFLVTSTARSGAEVFGAVAPEGSVHQYLPLDAPGFLARFLAHWRPDLSVWSEQDIWPGAIYAADRAGVPLALVNGRMNADSHARRARMRGVYRDVLGRFALVSAQDEATAGHLVDLGARDVRVDGPIKAAAPPLPAEPGALSAAKDGLAGRKVWLLASSHAEDEAVAMGAVSGDLLIISPRDPARGGEIAGAARARGLSVGLRSAGDGFDGDVYVADTFGEMGVWYRVADRALIGGTFGATEGHNPWEALALGCAVMHGPRVANFAGDYALLGAAGGVVPVTAEGLPAALQADVSGSVAAAQAIQSGARRGLDPLVQDLLGLMR